MEGGVGRGGGGFGSVAVHGGETSIEPSTQRCKGVVHESWILHSNRLFNPDC